MKKQLSLAIGASILTVGTAFAGIAPANAQTFSFSCDPSGGSDCAGDESGTFSLSSIFDSGSWLYTLSLDNTSNTVVEGTGAGITGFGLDFASWDASKFVANSLTVSRSIGGGLFEDISDKWAADPNGGSSVSNGSSFDGIQLSFIDFDAENTGNTNNSAIFNKDGLDSIITFRLTEEIEVDGGLLRFQRTGTDGEGSLKLVDRIPDVPHETVPEPAAMAGLLAVGAGIVVNRRKKAQQA